MCQQNCKYFTLLFISLCCLTACTKAAANTNHNIAGQHKNLLSSDRLFTNTFSQYKSTQSTPVNKSGATSSSNHPHKNIKHHKKLLLEKEYNLSPFIPAQKIFNSNNIAGWLIKPEIFNQDVYFCGLLRAPPFC